MLALNGTAPAELEYTFGHNINKPSEVFCSNYNLPYECLIKQNMELKNLCNLACHNSTYNMPVRSLVIIRCQYSLDRPPSMVKILHNITHTPRQTFLLIRPNSATKPTNIYIVLNIYCHITCYQQGHIWPCEHCA